jgi:hypothetical protein
MIKKWYLWEDEDRATTLTASPVANMIERFGVLCVQSNTIWATTPPQRLPQRNHANPVLCNRLNVYRTETNAQKNRLRIEIQI